jgi:hypothetical protein
MSKEIQNFELRSEEIQEILGKASKWIIRWGITLLFVVILSIILGTYFIQYPDIISATIKVNTINIPINLIAKTNGKLDTLFVSDKQEVSNGQILAVIENQTNLQDIIYLKSKLEYFYSQISCFKLLNLKLFGEKLKLGDMQSVYNEFVKSLKDYNSLIKGDYYNKKISLLRKQIITKEELIKKNEQTN